MPVARNQTVLYVQICEAKPNPMFTEEMRRTVRFLRYNRHVPCAECGRKMRLHWTMLCQFIATRPDQSFVVLQDGKSHPPLTPVCSEHPLRPDWPKPAARGKRKTK